VTDEQREKTIKCLLKVLDYQLQGVREQARDIEQHYKRVDDELKDFDLYLKREENKVIMDDIKVKMERAKEAAEEYERACGDEELWNVADLIVDNKLLIDRFDQIMGKPNANEVLAVTAESELGEISNSLVDQLYA